MSYLVSSTLQFDSPCLDMFVVKPCGCLVQDQVLYKYFCFAISCRHLRDQMILLMPTWGLNKQSGG